MVPPALHIRSELVQMPGHNGGWSGINEDHVKGKWQQKFLSSYLKETLKQYIEVYYRIFISALFGEIF